MCKSVLLVLMVAMLVGVAGCAVGAPLPPTVNAPPPTRVRTPTAVPANDEEAIRQLIVAEGEAVVQQDIDRLQAMWANDGTVIDANRTPDNPGDDKKWIGWGQLRDRYVNIVFPSNPSFAEHPNIRVTVTGETAVAVADTKIGVTNLKDNDRWMFRKVDGQWKVISLTFGLAPK